MVEDLVGNEPDGMHVNTLTTGSTTAKASCRVSIMSFRYTFVVGGAGQKDWGSVCAKDERDLSSEVTR
jgi:hypothetical protein